MNRSHLSWVLPLLLLFMAMALSPFIDMPIERLFFDVEPSKFIKNGFTEFVAGSCGERSFGRCDWGVFPAQLAGIGAILVYLVSFIMKAWKPWRKPALMLILTMAIGAGFITHTILKDNWGRPRPKQVVEFGGKQAFRAAYEPNFFHQPEPSKSFPCGHCTMGYFFFAFYFLGRRLNNKCMANGGLFLALALGITLSLTRMMQGGHFFTDTVAAGIIMWLTALTCDWLLFADEA